VARPRRASESGLARFLTDLEDDETIHVWVDHDGYSRSIILERRSPGCPTLHHRIMEPASADSARRRGQGEIIARDMERKMQSVSRLLQKHVAAQRAKRDPEAERRAREHLATPRPTTHEDLLDLEAQFSAQRMRIRVLERQLQEQGIAPAPTPDGRELHAVADVLDRCARGDITGLSCEHIRYLAAMVRGLGTWRE
jgi:hypothetical protein